MPEHGRIDPRAGGFPPVGQPALRALALVGVTRLEDLTAWTEADLAALHGVGAKGLVMLAEALAARGLGFRRP